MLIRFKRLAMFVAVGLLVAAGLTPAPARADLSTCSADSTPHAISPNGTQSVQFTVQNTDANAIQWMRVIVPTSDFAIMSTSISGWTDTTSGGSTSTFLTGGTLNSGDSITFTIDVQAGNTTTSGSNWSVYASDNPGGGNVIACQGDLAMDIQGQINVPLQVTNVQVTAVTTHSVVITWETNKPANSQVSYGADASYGSQTALDSNTVTSHAVTLAGLSTNTPYHFAAFSDDGNGTMTSGDNTFITADETAIAQSGGVAPLGGTGAGTVQVGGGKVTTPTGQPTEAVPPAIAFTNPPTGVFKAAPTFTGVASDNEAVAKVEYSTDGGKNWSGVTSVTPKTVTTGKGKNKVTTQDAHSVTFSFTPVITDDGNYDVRARATDPSGNQATTGVATIVIDRLPPRFSGELVAFGSQAAVPDAAGRWQAVVGLDQTITLGAVGGPTEVTIQSTRQGNKGSGQRYSLRRDNASGLWRGVLSFQSAGVYDLTVISVDGAGNRVLQGLAAASVSEAAKLVSKQGAAIADAKVTLYYRQPGTNAWVVWDGAGFAQTNPQKTKSNGTFQMLVPAGTYYLKAEGKGYQTLVTRQFTLNKPTPLAPIIQLSAKPKLGPIALPWISVRQTEIQPQGAAADTVRPSLVGKTLPNFNLPTTNGNTTTTVGLLGRPTLVTALSTWSPATSEQLSALDKLQDNHDLNIVPMVMGERASRVQAFLGRSDYSTDVTVDADVSLSALLGTPSLPTHYFIDRKGVIRAVWTGVFPYDKLLGQLSK